MVFSAKLHSPLSCPNTPLKEPMMYALEAWTQQHANLVLQLPANRDMLVKVLEALTRQLVPPSYEVRPTSEKNKHGK